MSFVAQRVRDPLHDLIEFSAGEFENAMWMAIQTAPFQRLRRVKQLGFSELVYPGATHTRFAHSLGVFKTARDLMGRIEALQGRVAYKESRAIRALAAALVHDVGQGPFSHAFEDVGERLGLKMASHEAVSDLVIRDSPLTAALNQLGTGFAHDVADIIRSQGPKDIYSAVVSSQFDADRLDYMRRDRLMCGTQHAAIDYGWLVSNLEIGEVRKGVDDQPSGSEQTFILGPKATYAAESYLLGLFHLYPTVYFHKATRGAEKLFSELLIRLFKLAQEGHVDATGLPRSHPLIKFALQPDSLHIAQGLDDTVFWGALDQTVYAEDTVVAEFSQRLRDRQLFKAYEVFSAPVLQEARDSGDPDFLDRIEARLKETLVDTTLRDGSSRVLLDRVKRPLYKELDKSKGPLNQILIRTEEGQLDVALVSPVIRAISTFQGLRLYAAPEATSLRDEIKEKAKEAIEYARAS